VVIGIIWLILSILGTFLSVFIPFWLLGKGLTWLGKWPQRWSHERLSLIETPATPTTHRKRRHSHLRLVQ